MLIVFGGLPGTGKTTVAREVARAMSATYLRIDEIEQAVRSARVLASDIGPAGYMAAYALAASNLALGGRVVADGVNPLAVTRAAWRDVAARAGAPIVEIEMTCSDPAIHRGRLEARRSDIAGLEPPRWASVVAHVYEPWTEPRLVIDTATTTAVVAVGLVLAAARDRPGRARTSR